MGNILDSINEQREQEIKAQLLEALKAKFVKALIDAEAHESELKFWVWLFSNKDKVARNRKLLDIVG